MVTSFCLLLVGAIASLIIARRCKSVKVYMVLISMLFLGFVVGNGVKSAVANVPTPIETLFVTPASPTVYGSTTAVVETVEDFKFVEPSKDLEGDTEVINNVDTTTTPNNAEIEDDS